MKKTILKNLAFLIFCLVAFQINAQFNGEGTYRIRNTSTNGAQVTPYATVTSVADIAATNGQNIVLQTTSIAGNTQLFDFIKNGQTFEYLEHQYPVYNIKSQVATAGVLEIQDADLGGQFVRLRGNTTVPSTDNEAGFIVIPQATGIYRIQSTAVKTGDAPTLLFLRAPSSIATFNAQAGAGAPTGKWNLEPEGTITANYWEPSANGDGTNKFWNVAANWSKGTVPTISEEVYVSKTETLHPTVPGNFGAECKNIVIESGVTLTVSSGGSLRFDEKSFGPLTFNINTTDTDWHLFSSAVVDEKYDGTWVDGNEIDRVGTGTNNGIAVYINTPDVDGDWTYIDDAAVTAGTGVLNSGQGYSIKRLGAGLDQFKITGNLKTDNLLSTIDVGNVGTINENRWNLVGNPYPAYILVSDLVASNTTSLSSTHKTVYVWDNAKVGGAGYSALLLTDYIYPHQGFFVNAANSTAENFTIDKTKLVHQTGATLFKGADNKVSINLFIEEGTEKLSTEINYLENKTLGLDPSFDIGTFTGASNEVSSSNEIYTQLVSDNEGVNFLRQALPSSDYENMVIPVGVKAAVGKEITFSLEALNLPSGLKVFLEDKYTNTFNRLDEVSSIYKVTLTEALDGIGRFYLHTLESVLSVSDAKLENVNVYKKDASTLRIVGLQQGEANVNLYNVLGKQVMNLSFNSNGVKDIPLLNLPTGVYILQLQTETGKLNRKIILE